MDAFSYLSVLLSIILGLGLTQLLTAAGRLVRERAHVRGDWLPLLWAAVLGLIYVQSWWAMFGLRFHREWTFLQFAVVLAQTGTLYLMSAVALPEQVDAGGVDLRRHYDRQHRWFFGFFLVTLVISVAKDVIVGGQLPGLSNLAFHGLLIVLSLSAFVVRGRRFQEGVGVVSAAVVATYIGLLFSRLQ